MQNFKTEMVAALNTEQTPFEANLETVPPDVNHRLQAHSAQLSVFGAKLEGVEQRLASPITEGISALQENQHSFLTDQTELVAATLVNASQQLLSPNNSPRRSTGSRVSLLAPNLPGMSTADSNSNDPSKQQPTGTALFDAAPHKMCSIKPVQENLVDLWCQWFGVAQCQDVHGGVPGGTKQFGKEWHKASGHLSGSALAHEQCDQSCHSQSPQNKGPPVDVIANWQPIHKASNCRVLTFVDGLIELGKIQKKKARGKLKKTAMRQLLQLQLLLSGSF